MSEIKPWLRVNTPATAIPLLPKCHPLNTMPVLLTHTMGTAIDISHMCPPAGRPEPTVQILPPITITTAIGADTLMQVIVIACIPGKVTTVFLSPALMRMLPVTATKSTARHLSPVQRHSITVAVRLSRHRPARQLPFLRLPAQMENSTQHLMSAMPRTLPPALPAGCILISTSGTA